MNQIYLSMSLSKGVLTNEIFSQWKYVIDLINSQPENIIAIQIVYYDNQSNTRNTLVYGDPNDISNTRSIDMANYCYPDSDSNIVNDYQSCIYLDNSYYSRLSSLFSIFKTLSVAIVLVGASFLFSKDLSELLLIPIESMIKIITSIKENPLNAIKIEEERAVTFDSINEQDEEALQEQKELESYETAILEKIVLKIGSLLAISFGEAGAEVIVQNIKATGAINPIIPGKKIDGIYGFCDIRSFTDITEILQEEVMTFVNSMAQIVHSTVDTYGGTANKNIGDAFLLVWKFPLEEDKLELLNLPKTTNPDLIRACYADFAILSFTKIIIELYRSRIVNEYNLNEKLTSRLKNFRVKIGSGLTRGWAIEGSLGSEYKIDASYLSPFVNLCMRLEGATKAYGVPLLIADAIRNTCSVGFQSLLRKVDSCEMMGDNPKIDLYAFDAIYSDLKLYPSEKTQKMQGLERKRYNFNHRIQKKNMIRSVILGEIKTIDIVNKSRDYQVIRAPYKPKFYDLWESGLEYFQKGNWEEAKGYFLKTLEYVPESIDGPSTLLLKHMASFNGIPPSDWKGLRDLD